MPLRELLLGCLGVSAATFLLNGVTLAQVQQVVPGGPAFEEGTLQAGDVVVAVNGCVVAGAWPRNHRPSSRSGPRVRKSFEPRAHVA